MPTLRLRADHGPVDLFRPEGDFQSLPVAPGDTVEVPGKVLHQAADVLVLGTDENDARGWPLAVWELVTPPRSGTDKTPEGK